MTIKRNTEQIMQELKNFCAEKGHFPSQKSDDADERSLAYAVSNNKYRQKFDDWQLREIEQLQKGESKDIKRTALMKLRQLREFIDTHGRWPNRTAADENERKLYTNTRRKYFENDPDLLKVYDDLKTRCAKSDTGLTQKIRRLYQKSGLTPKEFEEEVKKAIK